MQEWATQLLTKKLGFIFPYEKNVTYHRINPMKITDKSRVCHMIRIVLNLSREYHISSENVVG